MKNKKRFIIILIVIFSFSAFVRMLNVGMLVFGDDYKKNVYATSYAGSYLWNGLEGVTSVGEAEENEFVDEVKITFDKWYSVTKNELGVWGSLSIFGIQNIFDSVDEVEIEIDDRSLTYEECLEDYRTILKEYSVKALIFEVAVLLVCISLVILFVIWYIFTSRKMAMVDEDSICNKKMNMKYGLFIILLFALILEMLLFFAICSSSVLVFVLCMLVIWGPLYAITASIAIIVYYVKKTKFE